MPPLLPGANAPGYTMPPLPGLNTPLSNVIQVESHGGNRRTSAPCRWDHVADEHLQAEQVLLFHLQQRLDLSPRGWIGQRRQVALQSGYLGLQTGEQARQQVIQA